MVGGGREWEKEKGKKGIMVRGGKEKAGQMVNLMTALVLHI